mmetsp:Transcript_76622/g.212923  ORF Transcript_76622/g.212923 Transcript_76622/m.212923 type:complete len:303 (+) Transcript_76622:200-1108(+)
MQGHFFWEAHVHDLRHGIFRNIGAIHVSLGKLVAGCGARLVDRHVRDNFQVVVGWSRSGGRQRGAGQGVLWAAPNVPRGKNADGLEALAPARQRGRSGGFRSSERRWCCDRRHRRVARHAAATFPFGGVAPSVQHRQASGAQGLPVMLRRVFGPGGTPRGVDARFPIEPLGGDSLLDGEAVGAIATLLENVIDLLMRGLHNTFTIAVNHHKRRNRLDLELFPDLAEIVRPFQHHPLAMFATACAVEELQLLILRLVPRYEDNGNRVVAGCQDCVVKHRQELAEFLTRLGPTSGEIQEDRLAM